MKLTTDRARCEGHGVCVNQVPGLLDLDDDDIVVVLDPDRELTADEEKHANVAVASCPVAALGLA
ncbi:ferredoxin [Nocardioides ultimimeridianus]